METGTTTNAFTYTQDQQRAVEWLRRWWHDSRQWMSALGGLAGTGKTTIIARLAGELGVPIDYLAPTGKAVQVMNRKGIEAETIHSYIYDFRGKDKFTDERTGETREVMHFDRKDERAGDAPLVVVDEASMVNADIFDDIQRIASESGVRFIFVGDHGQLEPVGRNPRIMQNADIRLETIMRQAAENPILALAHRVRQQASLRENLDLADGDRLRIVGRASPDRVAEYAEQSGIQQIIVPFHRIRHEINKACRRRLGFDRQLCEGDRVVAKLNNRKQHVYNGNQFRIVSDPIEDVAYASPLGDKRYRASIQSIDDDRVWEDMLLYLPGRDGDWNEDCYKNDNIAIDYAYAITCHTAQGSEWDSVLAIYSPCRAWSNERWLYTAVTRAAKNLTVMAG